MKTSPWIVAGALLSVGVLPLRAQTAPTAPAPDPQMITPAVEGNKSTYSLRLRYVNPSIMAFWLDPRNHPAPAELAIMGGDLRKAASVFNPNNQSLFKLPPGVERIVAVNPQNTLLVFGTPEGVGELSRTIGFLDRPLRQIEAEAQFLSIAAKDVAALGLDFPFAGGGFRGIAPGTENKKSEVRVGFVRGNFAAALTALQAKGDVEILTAPRVTAINNLSAELVQKLSQPIELGTRGDQNTFNPLLSGTKHLPLAASIERTITLAVTPTLNNDGTVTLSMQPSVSQQLRFPGTPPLALEGTSAQVIANARDGEAIVLSGLDASAFEAQGGSEPHRLLLFVTPRIVHRAGDEIQAPTQP